MSISRYLIQEFIAVEYLRSNRAGSGNPSVSHVFRCILKKESNNLYARHQNIIQRFTRIIAKLYFVRGAISTGLQINAAITHEKSRQTELAMNS